MTNPVLCPWCRKPADDPITDLFIDWASELIWHRRCWDERMVQMGKKNE
jgi:hypothetical protein